MTPILICLLAPSIASAAPERWFYPNASDERVLLDDPARLTGAVLIGLAPGAPLPTHPDVLRAEWLTRRPAVARLVLRDGADDIAVSLALRERSDVRWSTPDLVVTWVPLTLPDDPDVGGQWHLENTGQGGWTPGVDINAEDAWALSTGAGITIAVLDSGTDPDHPDLDVTVGGDYITGKSDYTSQDMSHGTAAAGVAAAIGNNGVGVAGVAYDAHIFASRMVGSITESGTYYAFVDAVDAGAAVISNSWGYSRACEGYGIWSSLQDALEYAETEGRGGLGTVVVQAAGNDNCDISGDGLLGVPTVFGVAAISGNDDKEWYSSFGEHVDIAAPSGGLLTTDVTGSERGYGSYNGDSDYWDGFSGTSAATPVVSGVFALMFAANPRLTAADAREIICQTATRNDISDAEFDADGWSPYYGCGRVDAAAAVAAVADSAPGAPLPLLSDTDLYVDRIWLDWEAAADADGDFLRYEVLWWRAEDDPTEDGTLLDAGSGLAVELTGALEAGETFSWQVRAVDLWGPGPWSEVATHAVLDRPVAQTPDPVPQGCATAPRTPGGGLLLLSGLALLGRRRDRYRRA